MATKLLFVDDNPNVLDGFRAMLHARRKKWKAWYALNADEGLGLVDEVDFDIVIADMRMPGMNGADFLAKVAERRPSAVRIVLSGYSEMGAVLKSVKPAHQFLTKPCERDVLFGTIDRLTAIRDVLVDPKVQELVGRLQSLPALPEVYLRIQGALNRPEPSLKEVGEIVESDPGMSTAMLKVVNSSFFGFFNKVRSPSHAVTLLGIEAVRGLVLGLHLLKTFDASSHKGYSLERLWSHCLQTGHFARAIAVAEGLEDKEVDLCFIAGLLHDVGKLVLATELSGEYETVLERVRAENRPIREAEQDVLGLTHAEVGAYLLGLWGIDPSMVTAVHAHHDPARQGPGTTLALIVHAANTLQHELVVLNPCYNHSRLDEAWIREQGLEEKTAAWRAVCLETLGKAKDEDKPDKGENA